MNLINCPRHTRRGFIREGVQLPVVTQLDFPIRENHRLSQEIPAPPPAPEFKVTVDDTLPVPFPVASDGPRFLSWLAEEIAGQADISHLSEIDLCHRVTAKRILAAVESTQREASYSDEAKRLLSSLQAAVVSIDAEEADPYLDDHFGSANPEQMPVLPDSDHIDLSCELEAHYEAGEEIEKPLHLEYKETLRKRAAAKPRVEVSADGKRLEFYAAGSRILKDVLGRVVEVQSQFGDRLYMHYGAFGSLESVARTDRSGRPHSLGRMEKYGVIVRDENGRVMAAGQSMSIDPRGNFYVHALDGQFFSLDLVNGLHIERRRLMCEADQTCYATSVFTHDGFRMATMFSRRPCPGTKSGGIGSVHYRFYGRDGTRIDFDSDEDLRDLVPSRVARPASLPVSTTVFRKRQANTAWQSVKEYLTQVS